MTNTFKLKIRIQLVKPTKLAKPGYPSLEIPVQFGKPSFDWQKIWLTVLLASCILGVFSYTLLNWQENKLQQSDANQSIAVAKTATFSSGALFGNERIKTKTEATTKLFLSIGSAQTNKIGTATKEATTDLAVKLTRVTETNVTPAATKKVLANFKPSLIATSDDRQYVIRAQLTNVIQRSEPVNIVKNIWLEQGVTQRIYFFTQLQNLSGQQVTIRWYYQNEEVARVPLSVRGKRWRTYASKLLSQTRLGAWHVILTDQSGKQLARRDFTVNNRPEEVAD